MIFFVESSAISYCPVCGEPLSYRDSCERIMQLEGGERRKFLIRRHCWLEANRLRIDGYLKSTGYRLLGFSTELLESRVSLLDKLRSSRPEWLETLLRFLYNSGGFLVHI